MPVSLHVCMQTCFVLCHADLFFVVLSRRFRRWRRSFLLLRIFLATADVGCTYLPLLPEYYGLYYFVPYFSIKRLFFCKDSHIFRLRRYFCGVLGITSPIICGICVICVTLNPSQESVCESVWICGTKNNSHGWWQHIRWVGNQIK